MRTALTTAIALSATVAFTPLATAQQEGPALVMEPTVVSGRTISALVGPCKAYSEVTSPGLNAPIVLSPSSSDPTKGYGFGRVNRAGTYTASVQCDGMTLTAQFTVLRPVINWYLYPTEVEPGGTITAGGDVHTGCQGWGPLESPGFAEPLRFTRGGNFGRFSGDTKVITTPGTYEVVFQCTDRPERSVKTFRILGTPPTTTTPPNPQAPKPKPKPVVKPKGAPETGGGGTAP
ncbi:hypothetical protein SAMN04488074_103192 [Lentzea albidocapillata subsp. violacea]|uniref:Ig-like domain-containing protein n=1 Tax=Lentzea albidocapillata subsp. violacea TaxID=128104 RepID=A0A1G8WGL7_9PSEU|nr:hypothetical protein [Lentzea albidocapillata]SDJ77489.1 hypothetical protein SAMN04488074_103192 [Lentzea albidocapillata subsp. violacea]